jgi:hypothetical protein
MRAFIGIAATGIAVAAIGIWWHSTSNSATETSVVSKPALAGISVWEIHNQAHLESLPAQQFEDQSLVFAEQPR